jgi:hypothetical protein
MEEIQISTTKKLTVPANVDTIKITHEWGDVVKEESALTPGSQVIWMPDSMGVHKVQWLFGASVVSTVFYSVFMPLIDSNQFLEENPELEAFEDFIPKFERQVRHIIQNYTGRKFGPYYSKSMSIQGDGGDTLYLPVPVNSLSSVENNYGDNITELVEVCPNDHHLLQRSARFRGVQYYETKRDVFWNQYELFNERYNFIITGDWGYDYVPTEVSEAATLLIKGSLSDDDISEMRASGVFQMQLGDFMLKLNADQWGTTGNALADNLLASYVSLGLGLV